MTGELIPTGVTYGVGRISINNSFSGTAEFNNISLDSGGDFSGGTGGGVIYSGGTDLYGVFSCSALNVGVGNGVFKQKNNSNLEFRSFSAGTNTIITTGDTITINNGGTTHDFGTVSGVVDWNFNIHSRNAKIRLDGPVTLNIFNVKSGEYGRILIQQIIGSETISPGMGTNYVENNGSGALGLTMSAGSRDIASFFYDGTAFYWSIKNNFT